MTWVKLDDQWAQHPRMLRAGPLGRLLFVEILTYCARYLTDGEIPREAVAGLVDWSTWGIRERCADDGDDRHTAPVDNLGLADRLVAIGSLEETEAGYKVHDYLDYQRSKAEVIAEREACAERARRSRDKRSCNGVSHGVTSPLQQKSITVSHTAPGPDPDLTHTTRAALSPEAQRVANVIRSATSLSPILSADLLAEQIEGRRISKGQRIEWILDAIGEAARDVGAANAAGQPPSARVVAEMVVRYCDRARAPRHGDGNGEPTISPCREPFMVQGKTCPPRTPKRQDGPKAGQEQAS